MDNQEVREHLVLLLLGTSKSDSHSMLQIQKEFFYMWRSSERIKPLIRFIAHYRGPYSEGLKDTVINPMYLENLWDYLPPSNRDKLTGGFIRINSDGKKEFNRFMRAIKKKKNEDLIQLIAAMRLLHDLYDNLSSEEFLLLVYVNPDNHDFIKKSEIYNSIVNPKVKDKLYKRLKEVNPDLIEMGGIDG
jgi:hypothetical protein